MLSNVAYLGFPTALILWKLLRCERQGGREGEYEGGQGRDQGGSLFPGDRSSPPNARFRGGGEQVTGGQGVGLEAPPTVLQERRGSSSSSSSTAIGWFSPNIERFLYIVDLATPDMFFCDVNSCLVPVETHTKGGHASFRPPPISVPFVI